MNTFFNLGRSAALKTFSTLGVLAIVFLFITFVFAIEFSSFAVGMAKFVCGMVLVWLVDRFAIPEIDTMSLFKKEPLAYAIFLFGIFVLAGLCFGLS